MRYLFTGCLLFLLSNVSAQLPIYINEDFNDNNTNWWTGTGENYSMKIENSKYTIITTEVNSGRLTTITPFIDLQKDFSLEVTFVQKSGSDNNGFGIVWGGNADGKIHEFFIASNGYYKIKSPQGDDKINKWVAYKKINPVGSQNVLRVEQRKSKWIFFINDDKIETVDALPLFGSRMGVTNYTDMVLEVDKFIFRQDLKINLPPNLTTGLKKENLGEHINSSYDDLSPIISADGHTIYFGVENSPDNTGGVEDGEDVWMTTSEDGITWSKRRNMGAPINNNKANNLAAVSADNNMLIFCNSDGFQVRRRTADGWSELEYLNVRFSNEAKHMEASLSADGKAILFTVQLKSNVNYRANYEERDIYVTVQDDNGIWSNPINLGTIINTPFDETSPFLASDGRTLYFASSGRPGYGGSDIYMSKRQGNGWTSWAEPVNLGPEINSPTFDAYYTIPASANFAYMVSNKNSYGKTDIVRVKLPDAIKPEPVVLVSGKTLNAKTKEPIRAEVLFEDLTDRKEVGEAISDPKSGSYRITLAQGKNYGIRAAAKGYLSVNENLELISITQYTELEKNLYLVPIEVGEAIQLNNVFFEQGKPILKPESYPELDRLVTLMKENPSIKIELGGHTDNVGNQNALMKLSEDRVLSVKSYLEKNGIAKDRVTGKGYGPTQPVAPNDTEANRQRNRRVEFRITKK